MLLADKIVTLRKRAGWSQEELAAQLGVSRQSVSKWEGAQSVPDMQKVVQMSRLFGVTTDYLLKEELGEPEPAPAESAAPLHCVTMEQAADYLALRQAAFAPRHTRKGRWHGAVDPLGSRGCALRRSHGARARDPKMMCLQGNRKRKEPQGMPAALLQPCPCWCEAFRGCTPGRMPDTTAVWTSMPVERRE